MNVDEIFMSRCLQLAALAKGEVAPNPLVGAVLVHEGRIIGEGFHKQYGHPHAEVNCINSVAEQDKPLIPQSTLYVSLEPCSHVGKTPPCSRFIIHHRIPRVIIGMKDPFAEVNGKGILQLQEAGVEVTTGILEEECASLNRRFIYFHRYKRPYIVLKWAQSTNGKIAGEGNDRLLISNDFTNRLVHKWRSEEAAILVGTNTALADDPLLDNRHWFGKPPLKMVIDKQRRLPESLRLFQTTVPVIIFNSVSESREGEKQYVKIPFHDLPAEIAAFCFQQRIQSVLIEGGAALLQTFINANYWDETRVITNPQLYVDNGKPAPQLKNASLQASESIDGDVISYYVNNSR